MILSYTAALARARACARSIWRLCARVPPPAPPTRTPTPPSARDLLCAVRARLLTCGRTEKNPFFLDTPFVGPRRIKRRLSGQDCLVSLALRKLCYPDALVSLSVKKQSYLPALWNFLLRDAPCRGRARWPKERRSSRWRWPQEGEVGGGGMPP